MAPAKGRRTARRKAAPRQATRKAAPRQATASKRALARMAPSLPASTGAADVPGPHRPFFAKAGPRYHEAYAGVAKAVARLFPKARADVQWGMPAWLEPRPEAAPRERVGTFDPDVVFIGLADRKAGPTLHFWHPGGGYFLDGHATALKAAGLKPMRGCVAYERKGPYPIKAIEGMLEAGARIDDPWR